MQCGTPMTHPDGPALPCVKDRTHLRQDTDHQDAHGCTAPVLAHQASIRDAQRVQDLPRP